MRSLFSLTHWRINLSDLMFFRVPNVSKGLSNSIPPTLKRRLFIKWNKLKYESRWLLKGYNLDLPWLGLQCKHKESLIKQ
jgi:hypothetical protein